MRWSPRSVARYKSPNQQMGYRVTLISLCQCFDGRGCRTGCRVRNTRARIGGQIKSAWKISVTINHYRIKTFSRFYCVNESDDKATSYNENVNNRFSSRMWKHRTRGFAIDYTTVGDWSSDGKKSTFVGYFFRPVLPGRTASYFN